MWKCTKCGEQNESNFDCCWKCGTYRDGSPAPKDFESKKTVTHLNLDSEFERRFVCSKCKHREAEVKRISTTGTGLSKLIDIQHNTYISVSCERCGYTEFYNPEVLEGKAYLGSILDLLFGS